MKIKQLEEKLFRSLQLKVYVIAFICFMSAHAIQAQSTTISGTITDASTSEPLIGANVVILGTSTGVVTNFDGTFKITTNKGSTLRISYLGYFGKDVVIGDNTTINITLEEDRAELDEVVVVGYGTQKRKEVTGAVGQVKAEQIVQNATSSLANAIQGQVAGVRVAAQDGEPGSESNIIIRGVSSITGTTSPLYVVDGIPFDEDPRLSNDEIESIEILKDAASAAIYGTRGAGGVILITTKKSKPGLMKINLNSWYGLQRITSGTPLLRTEEWIYANGISQQNSPTPTYWDNTWTRIRNGVGRATNNSNLVDLVERDQQPIQNHSLNIAGGKEGLTYNLTAAFFNQDGAIINTGYDRFNLRANTQFKKGRWDIKTGVGFRLEERNRPSFQLLYNAFRNVPYQEQIDPDIEIVQQPGDINDSEGNQISQTVTRLKQTDEDKIDNFNANMTAKYDLTKNLSYSLRGGISYTNNTRTQITPLFAVTDTDGNIVPRFQRSGVTNTSGRVNRWTVENILNYKKSFGDHNFVLTAVYSAQSTKRRSFFARRLDLRNNQLLVLDNTTADPDAGNGNLFLNNTQSLTGLLGRLQYNYKGKYLLSASIRRDGSSQFGTDNLYGNFPSLSVGWNVSDENFWKPIKSTFTSLKTRASIGTVGNDRFLPYSDEAVIRPELDYATGPETANRLHLGAIQDGFANKNVKWETTISRNIGFDLGMFKNKLTITGDFYLTDKEDLLLPLLIPPSAGAGTNGQVILNVGNMTNRGMEWAVNYRHRGKFSWSVAATYTQNTNEVTKMSSTNKLLYLANSEPYRFGPTRDVVKVIAEGYEAGSFFLIKTDGIIKTEEELETYKNELEVGSEPRLGDVRLVDALTVDTDGDGKPDAGDGVINQDDQQYAGSAVPDFETGLNFTANYKGFDFSMQWYGSFGADIINGNKAFTYSQGVHRDRLYQWSPQNPTSQIATYQGGNHNNIRGRNDTWLEDGSFARLKNIAIGYSIPKKYLEPYNISKFRVYLAGQNLITLTDYTGYDPEVGGNGIATSGLDRGAYPFTSAFRLGAQISF